MSNFTEIVRNKFLTAANEHKMFKNTDCVVVGFSGGADSVCLLHLLNSVKETFGFNVKAVHVNHGIRGDEAERDEKFAKMFCIEHDIPFEIVIFDCVKEAEKAKESLEECGRRVRYSSFNSFCSDSSKIATAHNSNDNAETVIFNLTRGTSLKGICGIPYKRDNIVRPILDCTREEIEGYCAENRLDYVVDSTNLSTDYTRNKIRHLVLPVLKELNPNFLDAFSSFCNNASAVNSFLSEQAVLLLKKAEAEKFVYKRDVLLNSDEAVVTEMFVMTFKEFCGKSLDRQKVSALYELLLGGGRIQLYGDIFAESKKDYFRFYHSETNEKSKDVNINVLPLNCMFNNYSLEFSKIENNSKNVNHFTTLNMIDCKKTVGKLLLRTRMAGDELTLQKRNVTKSLKKLFNEADLPVEKRDLIPVISDDVGVVWVYGFGTTKRCSVSSESDNIILVRGKYNDRKDNA